MNINDRNADDITKSGRKKLKKNFELTIEILSASYSYKFLFVCQWKVLYIRICDKIKLLRIIVNMYVQHFCSLNKKTNARYPISYTL